MDGGFAGRPNADVLPPPPPPPAAEPEQQQPATTSHPTEVASCFANMASGSLPSFPPMPTSGSSLPSLAPTADPSFFPTPQHQHHSLQWPPTHTLFQDNLDLLNNDNILLQANHDDLSSIWCPPPLVAASQPQHVALFAGDPELQSNGRYRDAYERINLPPSSSGASSSTSPFFHNGGGDDDNFMDMTDYMIPQGDVTSSYFTPPPAAPQQQTWMWPASTTAQQCYSHEPAAMAAQVSPFDNMRVQANASPSHFAVPPPPPPHSQFYGHRRQLFMGMQRSRPPFWDKTSKNPIDAVLLGAAPSTRSAAPDAPPRKTAKTFHHRRGAGRPSGSTSKLGARAGKTTTSKAAMIQNIQSTTPGQEQHGPTTTTVAVVAADGKTAGVGDAGGRAETEEVVEYADTSPTGVRFNPKRKEIVGFLRTKYRGDKLPIDNIKEFDVYEAHPKTIIEKLGEGAENAWYVFSPRSRRYENGGRPARSVGSVGYWKSNSKKAQTAGGEGEVIGEDSVLTFVLGHQPKGETTDWRMVEYCLPEKQLQPGGKCKPGCRCRRTKPDGKCMLLDEWVICRISCNGEDGGARAKSRHRRRGG